MTLLAQYNVIYDYSTGSPVATCHGSRQEEMAAFIVQVMNNYDALVFALKIALNAYLHGSLDDGYVDPTGQRRHGIEFVRAALEAAKEEK